MQAALVQVRFVAVNVQAAVLVRQLGDVAVTLVRVLEGKLRRQEVHIVEGRV